MIIGSVISGVYFYSSYRLGLSADAANNIVFFALAGAQLLNVLNMRDPDENVFFNQISRNFWVWLSLGLCLAGLLAAFFIPLLRDILSLEAMGGQAWLLVAIGAIAPSIFIQILKQWVRS